MIGSFLKIAEEISTAPLNISFNLFYVVKVNGIYIVKSGTDFREFSEITLSFTDDHVDVSIDRVEVNCSTAEDPVIKDLVGKFQRKFVF